MTQVLKDMEALPCPNDGISELRFSPQNNMLAASSWDGNILIYEVQSKHSPVPLMSLFHGSPALSCAWSKDGMKIASGGADHAGKVFDLNTGQSTQVAQHDMPIKGIRWIENDQSGSTPMLVTGSWDKTIRLWDLRQKNPTMTVALPERLYAMDSLFPILVAGTAERHVVVYNLYNLSKPFKALTSPLKWQTRTVSCFAGGDGSGYGYGLGSIEGRVAIEYIEDQHRGKSYTFRCHRQGSIREPQNIYSVNSINWHPIHQRVFTTAGSDGVFSFWDRDGKMKLKAFPPVQGPISSTAFNRTGTIFAYAVSYEWNKGYAGARQQTQNKIMIHPIDESEMKLFQVGRR